MTSDHRWKFVLVECVCTDATLRRQRIERRVRDIPGWHEVGWDHVQRMKSEVVPVRNERLVIYALEPLEDNLRAVGAYTGLVD